MHHRDEVLNLLLQGAQQQHQDMRLILFGHVSQYDPTTHSVQVILSAYRDENDMPMQTNWIPLGSPWVGNNFGIQIAPHGGASLQNPTQGEQCIVLVFERDIGVFAVANLLFTDVMVPPYQLPNSQQIQAGECVIQHESGSFLHFRASGDVEVNANRDIIATATRDISATAQRDVNATATRDVNATATRNANVSATASANVTAGTVANVTAPLINLTSALVSAGLAGFRSLMQDFFIPVYNAHTHNDPQGGVTGVPVPQAVPAGITTINLKAS